MVVFKIDPPIRKVIPQLRRPCVRRTHRSDTGVVHLAGALDIPTSLVSGRIDASVGAIAANAITATRIANGAIDAATFAAGAIDATAIANGAIDAATFTAGAIDATAIADGAIDAATFASGAITATAIATDAITAGKIAANAITSSELDATAVQEIVDGVWDELIAGHLDAGSTGEALNSSGGGSSPNDIADALLDRANAIETGLTPRQAWRLMAAALAGKLSGAATTTVTIRNAVQDSKNRIVATVDADGNRSAVTTDVS